MAVKQAGDSGDVLAGFERVERAPKRGKAVRAFTLTVELANRFRLDRESVAFLGTERVDLYVDREQERIAFVANDDGQYRLGTADAGGGRGFTDAGIARRIRGDRTTTIHIPLVRAAPGVLIGELGPAGNGDGDSA